MQAILCFLHIVSVKNGSDFFPNLVFAVHTFYKIVLSLNNLLPVSMNNRIRLKGPYNTRNLEIETDVQC